MTTIIMAPAERAKCLLQVFLHNIIIIIIIIIIIVVMTFFIFIIIVIMMTMRAKDRSLESYHRIRKPVLESHYSLLTYPLDCSRWSRWWCWWWWWWPGWSLWCWWWLWIVQVRRVWLWRIWWFEDDCVLAASIVFLQLFGFGRLAERLPCSYLSSQQYKQAQLFKMTKHDKNHVQTDQLKEVAD